MDFDLTQNLIHIKNLSGVDFYFHSGVIENCTNLIFLQKQTTFVSIYAAIFHLRRPFLFAVGYVKVTDQSNIAMFWVKKLISQPTVPAEPPFFEQIILTH